MKLPLNCHNYEENLTVLWNVRICGTFGPKNPMNKIEWLVTVKKFPDNQEACLKYVLHSGKGVFQQDKILIILKTPIIRAVQDPLTVPHKEFQEE